MEEEEEEEEKEEFWGRRGRPGGGGGGATAARSGPGVPARRGSPQREVPGSSGPSETTETDAGPLDSSDEEPARPPGPRPRRPRRAPGPAPPHRGSAGEEGGAVRKPPRAKSQPSLEKSQRSGLTVANSHWVTEYMRCYSARLR
ncbi:hypothetical protein CRUP_001102 [Coryphaenoides rupestris]|nr:hypothetical protein CRUP_001102 [Coryphaenoides rupestris]